MTVFRKTQLAGLIFALGLTSGFRLEAKPITVGISLSDTRLPIVYALGQKLKADAEEAGMEVILLSAQSSAGRQAEHLRFFVERQVDLAIIYPLNRTAPPELEALHESGAPIITLENRIDSQYVDYHVETDQREAGRLAAVFLALNSSRMAPKFVIDILGDQTAWGPNELNRWFDLEVDNWKWVRIARKLLITDDAKAREQIALTLEQTMANVVFLPSETYLEQALAAAGNRVWIVVTDGSEQALDYLAQGEIKAVIVRPVAGIALTAVEAGRRLVFGNEFEQRIASLPPYLVTVNNVDWIRARLNQP